MKRTHKVIIALVAITVGSQIQAMAGEAGVAARRGAAAARRGLATEATTTAGRAARQSGRAARSGMAPEAEVEAIQGRGYHGPAVPRQRMGESLRTEQTGIGRGGMMQPTAQPGVVTRGGLAGGGVQTRGFATTVQPRDLHKEWEKYREKAAEDSKFGLSFSLRGISRSKRFEDRELLEQIELFEKKELDSLKVLVSLEKIEKLVNTDPRQVTPLMISEIKESSFMKDSPIKFKNYVFETLDLVGDLQEAYKTKESFLGKIPYGFKKGKLFMYLQAIQHAIHKANVFYKVREMNLLTTGDILTKYEPMVNFANEYFANQQDVQEVNAIKRQLDSILASGGPMDKSIGAFYTFYIDYKKVVPLIEKLEEIFARNIPSYAEQAEQKTQEKEFQSAEEALKKAQQRQEEAQRKREQEQQAKRQEYARQREEQAHEQARGRQWRQWGRQAEQQQSWQDADVRNVKPLLDMTVQDINKADVHVLEALFRKESNPKALYHQLQRKYHPDVTQEKGAKEAIQKINSAFESLGK